MNVLNIILGKKVIPANAGVILLSAVGSIKNPRYPRECGGDPNLSMDNE